MTEQQNSKSAGKQTDESSTAAVTTPKSSALKRASSEEINAGPPSFIRDILPYFMASYTFVISHIVYQMTGNLLIPIWLAYMASMSQLWYNKKDYKETNLDRESESLFNKDKRFMLPLYTFVLNDTLNWIWCLFLVSGINPLEHTSASFIFENKHGESVANWAIFTFVWGYMAGLSGLAGHELIHKRESYNKAIGAIPFTKMLYTHFILEHGSGHHRHVGTKDDPATASFGQTFYNFFPKSAYGGLRNTHLREVERIHTEFSEKSR